MRLEKTSTLAEIIAQGTLGDLQAQSGLIARLDALLGFYLDRKMRGWVQVASYNDGTLTLACSNGTVAGQLRYLSRIYMQQLRQHGEFCDLKRIRAVMGPAARTSGTGCRHPRLRRLSPATGKLLVSLSEDLGTGEVSEALRRLARHAEPADDRSSGA